MRAHAALALRACISAAALTVLLQASKQPALYPAIPSSSVRLGHKPNLESMHQDASSPPPEQGPRISFWHMVASRTLPDLSLGQTRMLVALYPLASAFKRRHRYCRCRMSTWKVILEKHLSHRRDRGLHYIFPIQTFLQILSIAHVSLKGGHLGVSLPIDKCVWVTDAQGLVAQNHLACHGKDKLIEKDKTLAAGTNLLVRTIRRENNCLG